MNQQKVYEFAKEVGIETLTLMDKIREWKLPIKSHMATLDPEQITEIRSRLSAESGSRERTKRAVTKKVATIKPKPAAEKPPVTKKKVVKKETAAVDALAAENAKKTTGVIRRKAGALEREAELAAAAAAAAEAEEAAMAALKPQAAEQEHTVASPNHEAQAVTSQPAAPAVPQRVLPVRRNIIGRMDLKRVTRTPQTPQQNQGGTTSPSTGAAGGAAGAAARPLRNTQRNIRTGFFSAPTVNFTETEAEIAKKKNAGPRETEVKHFSATEFRKREVIFQPKKKKVMSGRNEVRKTLITTPAAHKRIVKMYESIKVSELAAQLGIKVPELTKKLMANGVMANMNSDLDFDTVALIAPEFKFEAQTLHQSAEDMISSVAFGDLTAELITRPPVVTVMGHVDHGKTSLLDAIRKADVASGEAGGITQHIGAYSVKVGDGQVVTFLDTPGHEAFTAMRARGANVTDIAIIVVAADDGVMPQTVEAINHAKAANVPMIIAVNKIDRPNANMDRIKQQLTEYEIVPEEWGGSQIFVGVSAVQKTGIDTLLEQILLLSEVLDLKANPARSAWGIVIESRMEKGRGPVATVLVKDGTLNVSQPIVAGMVPGRIRSMRNDRDESVNQVLPGYPVEVMGLEEVPQAGDRFDICENDEIARKLAADRRSLHLQQSTTPNQKMSLEQIFSKVKAGDVRELNVVLKADVAGSLEAIKAVLEKMGNQEVKIKLVHTAVGGISESDVLLANTSNGLILGFNVRPDAGAQRMAKEKGIEVKTYSIIYEMQDDLKKALTGLLAPEFVEKILGRAEVRNIFVVPKIGTIGGCAVVDGKIARNASVRLIRDGKIITEGKISSLKRFKDDAKEVAQGFECGIGIENYNDLKPNDVIEAFIKEQVARAL